MLLQKSFQKVAKGYPWSGEWGFCLCLLSPLFGDGEVVCEQARACYCVIFCSCAGVKPAASSFRQQQNKSGEFVQKSL